MNGKGTNEDTTHKPATDDDDDAATTLTTVPQLQQHPPSQCYTYAGRADYTTRLIHEEMRTDHQSIYYTSSILSYPCVVLASVIL